jgi:hypothetical protein
MARFLCRICRYAVPMTARVANVLAVYLHCMQGVPGAPYRDVCPVFMREIGTDDEWRNARLRGQMPTRYPAIAARGARVRLLINRCHAMVRHTTRFGTSP